MLPDVLKPPSLMSSKRVLCVQPHPDDMECSAGGTIALLAARGATVVYVTVTDGAWGAFEPVDPAELAETRRREQVEACQVLGVEEIAWLDFPDGQVPPGSGHVLCRHLVSLIRSYRPDCVMTVDPWTPYEAHPDHYNTGLAVAAAVLFSGLAAAHREEGLEPHSPEMVAFAVTTRPNTWVAVDEVWERRTRALEAHRSQFSTPAGEVQKTLLRLQAEELARRGRAAGKLQEGVTLAEAFKVLSPLHLHCNWEAHKC